MTTLVTIPSVTALHLPTATSSPLPLSSGELLLTLLPAAPPARPSQVLTLTIGSSSFPLLPISPVQKTQSVKEHASYVFSPAPADGGAPIGMVKIVMKDSKSQGEWEATEAMCRKFEEELKANGVWDEKTLFVDDEYETGGLDTSGHKGWGESIAAAAAGAAQALAGRLQGYTDNHVATTNPTHPQPPTDAVKSRAKQANDATASIAESASSGATALGSFVHDAGKKLGSMLPDSIAKAAEPVPDAEKSDFRKMAEGGWEQVTIAAKGVGQAAVTVGTAVSGSAHKAVEHNFGKEAEGVAQDVGQTGANIGSTGMSAFEATSAIMHTKNAGQGVLDSKQP